MNTPAHAVANLVLLGGGARRDAGRWILAGAVLPDLPMFGFYLWERLVAGEPESRIWGVLYFQPGWQDLFDWFNSIPIAAAGALVAWRLGRRGVALLFASMLVHFALDLPLHHDDAHRHFLPLSDWRFQSPVSYWNPAHHGAAAALGEALVVASGAGVLWRRYPSRAVRAGLMAISVLYAVGYLGFYVGR